MPHPPMYKGFEACYVNRLIVKRTSGKWPIEDGKFC